MLARSAAAAAAATAGWQAFQPLFASPQSRWFKIGACEWSLMKGKAGPECFEAAKEIGLDGVQVDMGKPIADAAPPHKVVKPANDLPLMHLLKPDFQQAYLASARHTGLEIASLAISAFNRVPLKSDPRAAQWLADSIDVCKALSVKIVMPAFFGKGELDMSNAAEIERVVQALKNVAPRAEKEGIAIGLENYLSADDNRRLIEQVGSPSIKVYYDVGNSTDKGRDVCKEIRELGPLICEFHAKDAKSMLGQGRIDFHQVRRAIDDIGYNGWIHLEAATPHGLVADYSANYRYLRGCFPEKL